MISLSEYKQHLISVYSWPIDSSMDEFKKRKKIMNDKYPDEYIEKIISDTKDFIYDVLSSKTIKSGYSLKEIHADTTSYIKLEHYILMQQPPIKTSLLNQSFCEISWMK